jgi:uncharacterized membrane protein YcaP (DUF421 family)
VVLVGTAAYAAVIVVLRTSGKRTLAKMNAFDLVVTVALGSTLATVLLSRDVALAEGVLAFILLAVLQAAVSWMSLRSARVRRAVKSEPRLLVHRGRPLEAAMRSERVHMEEVLQALRRSGRSGLEGVHAVVLETDGTISVVADPPPGDGGTLGNVSGG